jgi:4-hydroxy-tetrahydrodipicolinate synthase
MKNRMTTFTGIYTALITPFKNGKVDEKAFQDFCEWQIKEGVHGLVPCGTTGESPTLTYEEHQRVIELCVEVAKGRVKVLAGTGANATEEAIMFTKHAKKVGANGALIVTPYYNKPTAEGQYQHFKAIHDAVEIPIILYNVPARSVINMSDETITRLAKLKHIAGIKDATGDLARPYTLRTQLNKTGAGADFIQLSGEDQTAVAFNASGGVGCISVSSNIAPKACAQVQEATLKGDFKGALALHEKLVELHSVMFCETSPAPVKYAASLMGKCSPDVRLPLVSASAENQGRIREVLVNLGLL